MGWLHAGHRVARSSAPGRTNAATVATIFVNPRQFNEAADYQRYPRNEARDIAICEEEGVDLVFAPDVDEIYPAGFDTTVSVGAIARPLEGAARPGHFDGVATVVAILFDLIGAEHALLRPEGRPAGAWSSARWPATSRSPTEVDRVPDGPRAGRPRALVAERPPVAGRARRGAGPAAGVARGAGAMGGAANAPASAAGDDVRRRSRRSRSRPRRTSASPMGRPSPSSTGCRTAAGAPVTRGPVRPDPPDRQRAPALAGTRASAAPGSVVLRRDGSSRITVRGRRRPAGAFEASVHTFRVLIAR